MFARGQSEDAVEGVTSFLEKREPRFADRVSDGLPELFPAARGTRVLVRRGRLRVSRLERLDRRALEHRAVDVEARAVARAVPAALGAR